MNEIKAVDHKQLTAKPRDLNGDLCRCCHSLQEIIEDRMIRAIYGDQLSHLKGPIQTYGGLKAMVTKTLGNIGYDAYRAHTDGKSLISGQPIPEFENLSVPIQNAWEAAGQAVAASVGRGSEIAGDVEA